MKTIYISWQELKPTYRGREVKSPEALKVNDIRRMSIMNRRYVERSFSPHFLFGHLINGLSPYDSLYKAVSDYPVRAVGVLLGLGAVLLPSAEVLGRAYTTSEHDLTLHVDSFFDTQSGPFKLDLVSISKIPSTSALASSLPATMSTDADCKSTTSTLKGDDQDEKGNNSDDQKSGGRQGFWSRFSCL